MGLGQGVPEQQDGTQTDHTTGPLGVWEGSRRARERVGTVWGAPCHGGVGQGDLLVEAAGGRWGLVQLDRSNSE